MAMTVEGKELISMVNACKKKAQKVAAASGLCTTVMAGCLGADLYCGSKPAYTVMSAVLTAISSFLTGRKIKDLLDWKKAEKLLKNNENLPDMLIEGAKKYLKVEKPAASDVVKDATKM